MAHLTFDANGQVVDSTPLTPAEQAEIDGQTNDSTIGTRLESRLTDLQAIIDRPQTVLADNTVAAIRTAIRDLQGEVKTLARVDRLQTRWLLRLLDGTD